MTNNRGWVVAKGAISNHCTCTDDCSCPADMLATFISDTKQFWNITQNGENGNAWVENSRGVFIHTLTADKLIDYIAGNNSLWNMTYTVWLRRIGITLYSHDTPTGIVFTIYPAEYTACVECGEQYLIIGDFLERDPGYIVIDGMTYCNHRYADCTPEE